MKKLLITNLVTAVVVLGIIAAYSFKPEQKAGAKYATVTIRSYDFIMITVDGKSETIDVDTKHQVSGFDKYSNMKSNQTLAIQNELEKLETKGYQLIAIAPHTSAGNTDGTDFVLRKP